MIEHPIHHRHEAEIWRELRAELPANSPPVFADEHLQPLNDPLGCFFADELPGLACPPLAGDVDAVGGQQTESHCLEALTFTHDLLALAGKGPVAFFVLARHAHDTESFAVAPGEAIEPLTEG